MTLERFRELWNLRGIQGDIPLSFRPPYALGAFYEPNGITEAEHMEVRKRWDAMPGHTCWLDAFHALWKEAIK